VSWYYLRASTLNHCSYRIDRQAVSTARFCHADSLCCLTVLWRCWLGGSKGIRPVKSFEWWGVGMVICLERGADLHMTQLSWFHCRPLSLASVKCRLVLPFWYWLTWIVPKKRAVKRVCVWQCMLFFGEWCGCECASYLVALSLDQEQGEAAAALAASDVWLGADANTVLSEWVTESCCQ